MSNYIESLEKVKELILNRMPDSAITIIDSVVLNTCAWIQDDDGSYDGACGIKFEFINGGCEDNDFRFCPSCGKAIAAAQEEGK